MTAASARRAAAALALAAWAAAPASAAVRAVLSSESEHYRQAYEGFQEAWGESVPAAILGRDEVAEGDVVVAFGSRAAMRPWPGAPFRVACLAPGAPRRDDLVSVEMLPEPGPLVARIKRLMPRIKVLRVLWSSALEDGQVGELAAAAEAQGIKVLSERVEDPARLPEHLRLLSGRSDALWLMPDPLLVSARNFAVLREFSAAARVPFFAPTEGLAEKGATATLAAPFRDIGRAAAAALKELQAGGRPRDHYHPSRVVVTVSLSAARASGLDLAEAAEVDRTVP
ncbi:MAG: hypothetical protein HY079_14070 [Elusimicrobia bacterium]|nr:hypothetical protein [Elusimicrobiota bacterium]